MTKKNKVIYRLLGVFVVLLLVSLCLLGSTFARYTTDGGSGTATVGVAQWSVTVTGAGQSGSKDITFSDLSPNQASYTSGSSGTVSANSSGYNGSGYRYNSTAATQIVTITNSSEVDALITIDIGTISITDSITGITSETYNGDTNYTEDQVKGLFSIVLCDSDGSALAAGSGYGVTSVTGTQVTIKLADSSQASSNSFSLYAYVTWTSCDSLSSSLSDSGVAADKLDTLVGQTITSGVSWTLSYSAVQASTAPSHQ